MRLSPSQSRQLLINKLILNCRKLHTNRLGGHCNKFIIFLGGDAHFHLHIVGRVTRGDSFLLAHVPSHHVAKSQNGTVLRLRTLRLNEANKHQAWLKSRTLKQTNHLVFYTKQHTWVSLVILTKFCTAVCSSLPVIVETTTAYNWAASSLMSSLFVFIIL